MSRRFPILPIIADSIASCGSMTLADAPADVPDSTGARRAGDQRDAMNSSCPKTPADIFQMPGGLESNQHARPFVYDDPTSRSLHFSIMELQSRMRLQHPDVLVVDYTRTMMGFLRFNSRPGSIAMIGLGGGSLAKFCYRYLPDTQFTVVEINPHVIALRDEFCVPKDDQRFRVIQGDGAHFVRDASTRFDVVLVDGYDSQGQSAQLCTQRFYDDCLDLLMPDGIIVVNLYSRNPDYGVYMERLRRSFGDAVLEVSVKEQSNGIVFGCKGTLIQRQPIGATGRPGVLDQEAWKQLKPAFSQIASALKRRFDRTPSMSTNERIA